MRLLVALLPSLFLSLVLLDSSIAAQTERSLRDTVLEQLEEGRIDKAAKTLKKITHPRTLVGMRVDNRFSKLVDAEPNYFDIERASEAFEVEMRTIMEKKPKSLEAVVGY